MNEILFGRKIQMKELKDYYEKSKRKWLKWCMLAWTFFTIIFNFIKEVISNSFTTWATNPNVTWINLNSEKYFQEVLTLVFVCVAPTTIALTSYFAILNYINKIGWKKKFPQNDVSGEWLDTTTYTKSLGDQKDGWVMSNKVSISSPIHIEQTCQTVKVKPSIGIAFEWHSILADWDDKNNLNILYTVEYNESLQEKEYPERRTGYEKMSIDTVGLSAKQKPRKMVGKFWHCLSWDGKPMHMGDVIYERKLTQ